MSDNLPREATTAEIAQALGISSRRLQQLAAEGWIDGRLKRGLWDVRRTMSTYASHVQLSTILGPRV